MNVKTLKLILSESERGLLTYLLEQHMNNGYYFGNKILHNKMTSILLKKLNKEGGA